MVVVLGIESTAHTFGIGIVRNGKILANVKDAYTTEKGGIIPVESAKHHERAAEGVYFKALAEAGINEKEIDAISFSQGPGLSPCLLVGLKKAKELAKKIGVPLVPINHCIAHLEVGRTTGAKDPVMLYVSGANTQIIAYEAGKYRIFGETLDIGVGNFIDTFARYAGIGFPGGPKIEQLAKGSKNYVEIPYTVKGMDIALSGILTNLRQKLERIDELKNISQPPTPDQSRDLSQQSSTNLREIAHPPIKNVNAKSNYNKTESSEKFSNLNYTLSDLAYSLQETVFAMLVETAERALAHTGKKELLLGGGVACNSRLQEMCRIMCDERGCKLFVPEKSLLVDNGTMIAYLGEILYKNEEYVNLDKINSVDIAPRQRTDQVEIKYK